MTTCRGDHDLRTILAMGPEMAETVIRWCDRCGAITGDIDADGRTAPGAVIPMRLPATEREKQGV